MLTEQVVFFVTPTWVIRETSKAAYSPDFSASLIFVSHLPRLHPPPPTWSPSQRTLLITKKSIEVVLSAWSNIYLYTGCPYTNFLSWDILKPNLTDAIIHADITNSIISLLNVMWFQLLLLDIYIGVEFFIAFHRCLPWQNPFQALKHAAHIGIGISKGSQRWVEKRASIQKLIARIFRK